MKLTRLVLLAAAAAGASYWFRERGRGGLPAAPRPRLEPGGGVPMVKSGTSPVAETVWTPADPAAAPVQTVGPAAAV